MNWLAIRKSRYLMTARKPIGYNDGVLRNFPQHRKQALLGDFNREFGMLFLITERASHTAAASIGVADNRTRYSLQQFVRPAATIQGFLVAMAVHDEMPRLVFD